MSETLWAGILSALVTAVLATIAWFVRERTSLFRTRIDWANLRLSGSHVIPKGELASETLTTYWSYGAILAKANTPIRDVRIYVSDHTLAFSFKPELRSARFENSASGKFIAIDTLKGGDYFLTLSGTGRWAQHLGIKDVEAHEAVVRERYALGNITPNSVQRYARGFVAGASAAFIGALLGMLLGNLISKSDQSASSSDAPKAMETQKKVSDP